MTRLGFAEPPGAGNVLCVGSSVDLPSTYSMTLERTDRLETFMQVDSATADLGYVTNRGWSSKRGVYESKDDLFVLSAEMEMSDHPLTQNNENFEVLMAAKYDDIIVVSSQVITSVRPTAGGLLDYNVTMEGHVQNDTYQRPRYDEEPKILVDVFTLDNTTPFNINETVEVVSVIRHDLNSQGGPNLRHLFAFAVYDCLGKRFCPKTTRAAARANSKQFKSLHCPQEKLFRAEFASSRQTT